MGKANTLKKGMLPDMDTMVSNVLEVFDRATAADVEEGATWYPKAFESCEAISELSGYSLEVVAGVMALTSIATGWALNESMPARILARVSKGDRSKPSWYTGSNPMWEVVLRVVDGDITAIKGTKTSKFFAAIMGDDSAVTIDRHAMRIAYGSGMWDSATLGNHRLMWEAYTIASDMRGVTPRTMQATTWVRYRKDRGLDKKYG